MSHPIPKDAQRLADRLRAAADEILSAARYGVPIPDLVTTPATRYTDEPAPITPHVIESVRLLWGDRAAEALAARSES